MALGASKRCAATRHKCVCKSVFKCRLCFAAQTIQVAVQRCTAHSLATLLATKANDQESTLVPKPPAWASADDESWCNLAYWRNSPTAPLNAGTAGGAGVKCCYGKTPPWLCAGAGNDPEETRHQGQRGLLNRPPRKHNRLLRARASARHALPTTSPNVVFW